MIKNRIAVFGEAVIDMIENNDCLFEAHVGGSPFNACRAFSRMGCDTHYLSPISTDEMGKKILRCALKDNISVPSFGASNKPTSLAIVSTDEHGSPDYVLYRDFVADLDIESDKLISIIPDYTDLFHTGSLALVPRMKDSLISVFEHLRNKGSRISIDINIRKSTFTDGDKYYDAVRELTGYADYVKVSDEDLNFISPDKNHLDACKELLDGKYTSMVAYTEGAKGATLITETAIVSCAAIIPDKMGDTVGAGDTFFASLLSHLILNNEMNSESSTFSEQTLQLALHFALTAASINVSRSGCHPPHFDEVAEKLRVFQSEKITSMKL